MLHFNKNRIFSTLAIAVILTACAKIVAPTGGPKDITPPKLVRSTPGLKSTNFKGKEVVLTFDEFLQLKDIVTQVVVSPPPAKQPEIKLKGRSIVLRFSENLKPNSTYSIYFGDAIQDLNEGNAKKNYYFTFSTGTQLDTMELRGRVSNAQTGLPEKDVIVSLYTEMKDSIPYKERPFYISKTNAGGDFTIKYLADKPYKLFAVKDANSNLLFDLPSEAIAFDSKPVKPEAPLPDSCDSIKRINTGIYHQLALFQEQDSLQHVEKTVVTQRKKISFAFKYPVKTLLLDPLNFKKDNWGAYEWNQRRDSLDCWLAPAMPDTLQFKIKADNMKPDTLQFILKTEKASSRKAKSGKEQIKPKDKIAIRIASSHGSTQPYNSPLIFETENPVNEKTLKGLRLAHLKDTIFVDATLTDTLSHRRFIVNQKWKEKSSYTLLIPEGKLTDIYGATNDSVNLMISTWEERDYGTFKVDANIKTTKGQWLFQLMTEKDVLLREQAATKSGIITFSLLAPGKYALKMIYDENNNGVWDTGKYLQNRQPEKVIRFNGPITIRANWDQEEKVELKAD
jgi:hypothetical protein